MWFINLGVDVIDVVDEAVRCQSLPSFHLIIMLWALIVAILLQRNTSSSTGKGMYRSRAILIKRHTLSAFTVLDGIIFPDTWFLPFVLWFCQMKLKKTGDWRREILGDMTVMNAEEVQCTSFGFLSVFCWHFTAFSVFTLDYT